MIKLPKTKIYNSTDKIDEHLDVIYHLKTEFNKVDNDVMINLLDSIDSWKDCISEIEIEIKSIQDLDYELKIDNTQEELILY
jgi:hypothetical protein